jgi:hypothetical protein
MLPASERALIPADVDRLAASYTLVVGNGQKSHNINIAHCDAGRDSAIGEKGGPCLKLADILAPICDVRDFGQLAGLNLG